MSLFKWVTSFVHYIRIRNATTEYANKFKRAKYQSLVSYRNQFLYSTPTVLQLTPTYSSFLFPSNSDYPLKDLLIILPYFKGFYKTKYNKVRRSIGLVKEYDFSSC